MVKVIMGLKGSGKTKQMIELINAAAGTEHGNVVAIERCPKLTFDLHYKIRLIDSGSFEGSFASTWTLRCTTAEEYWPSLQLCCHQ